MLKTLLCCQPLSLCYAPSPAACLVGLLAPKFSLPVFFSHTRRSFFLRFWEDGGHGHGELRAEAPDALALLLGDAPVLHSVRDGGDGRDGPVLRRPLLVGVPGGHRRPELGDCLGGVSLHRTGRVACMYHE